MPVDQNSANVVHTGEHVFQGPVTLPASVISDNQVASSASIDTAKVKHRHSKHYGQNGTASSVTIPIHIARAAGSVVAIEAGSIVANIGAATVTIDLKKNGSSILTGVITLDSGNTARVLEAGTISSASYVDGDFFELVIVATAGGGTLATGLGVEVTFNENPS